MLDLRPIPVVIFAASCLLTLKIAGLVSGSAGMQASVVAAVEEQTWNPFAAGADGASVDPVVTGTTPERKSGGIQHPRAGEEQPDLSDVPPPTLPAHDRAPSSAERALIERLQERRQDLEARARDLEMRESLLKAAEKRLEARIEELKEIEGKSGEAAERLKSIVVMYEAMRPKDAARIFDRLESALLVDVVNQMDPRKASEIMAQMQPATAERLTTELARRKREPLHALPATDLLRIERDAR